jgi:two-component system response regulator HydG
MTQERSRILLCDDDVEFMRSLRLSLKNRFEVDTAGSVVEAKKLLKESEYDVAVIDLDFEGQEYDGVDLLDYLGNKVPGTFVVILSGDQEVERCIRAMRRKHFEMIRKNENFFESLLFSVDRAAQVARNRRSSRLRTYRSVAPSVREMLVKAEKIIQSGNDASILLLGESGTGKEILVQHLAHLAGKRHFSANVANVPDATAETVLFGHERGSFTGAHQNKVGMIEAANGGMLFLDEIGECSPAIQAKLLRVLESKEITPHGSNQIRKVNVQFIAATHRDLQSMVAHGSFRLDLFQRLKTFVLRLPALRERREDILYYADLFLAEAGSAEVSYTISDDGAKALAAYDWPGNIRELKTAIQRFIVLSNRTVLDAEGVEAVLHDGSVGKENLSASEHRRLKLRNEIADSLRKNSGSKWLTARTLGISQATLYRRIRELGIGSDFPQEVG